MGSQFVHVKKWREFVDEIDPWSKCLNPIKHVFCIKKDVFDAELFKPES